MAMKNLKDTILEKLSIDNINLDGEFPIDGTLEDMVEFLERQGFKHIQHVDDVNKLFNSAKSKSFTVTNINKVYYLWFADTSKEKISKKNPIFYYSREIGKYPRYMVFGTDNSGYSVCIAYDSKDKFLSELNKRFGW